MFKQGKNTLPLGPPWDGIDTIRSFIFLQSQCKVTQGTTRTFSPFWTGIIQILSYLSRWYLDSVTLYHVNRHNSSVEEETDGDLSLFFESKVNLRSSPSFVAVVDDGWVIFLSSGGLILEAISENRSSKGQEEIVCFKNTSGSSLSFLIISICKAS